jgi:hypothetical protein
MSAACHATTNQILIGRASLVGEFRFFVSNWFVCLLEIAFHRLFPSGATQETSLWAGTWTRLLSYIWTMLVIFSLTPAWQYPLVRASVGF